VIERLGDNGVDCVRGGSREPSALGLGVRVSGPVLQIQVIAPAFQSLLDPFARFSSPRVAMLRQIDGRQTVLSGGDGWVAGLHWLVRLLLL
jgi:hypothetical protein